MPERPIQILLIDDDDDDLEILSSLLSLKGIRTKCFDSGEKALYYLDLVEDSSDGPLLIVLDYNMPRMNGQQILKMITERAGSRRIPVIIYSTTVTDTFRKRFADMGALDCFTKPNSYSGLDEQTAVFRDMVCALTPVKNSAG